jgi:hypothetical protein
MNQEFATLIPLNDRGQEFNLYWPIEERFKELPIPTTRAVAVSGREKYSGFVY